ncbi:hypothetical protein pb186bvf_018927 [Paramecium bursaria]
MVRFLQEFLDGTHIYSCKKCSVQLTNLDALVSKQFTGQTGKAYLFEKGINLNTGPSEEKELKTGKHIVQDVTCKGCNIYVGWKYILAMEQSQKYKEGKIIIEKAFIKKMLWDKNN